MAIEITEQQFEANLNQMPEEQQAMVINLIDQTDQPVLQAFATSLGVELDMSDTTGEEQMAEEAQGMPEEGVLDEVLAEQAAEPMEEEMAPAPMPEAPAPMPEAPSMDQQMQQLARGDQVAGMINEPGAENQTGVADDVEMNAEADSYIVNSAAIAKVGRKDFEERIIEPAIKYLKDKEGVEIQLADIVRPSAQTNGDVPVLASNNEYYIPKRLAEVIGTDLLDKINKRGEKDTEKKIKEQQAAEAQQPQQPSGERQIPVRANEGGKIDPEKKLFSSIQAKLVEVEGFEPVARIPTDGDRLTIGYGSTENVKEGQTIDKPTAKILLGTDINKRLPRIRKEIPIFSDLPVEIQTPMFVEHFRGSLTRKGSPETVKLINEGKYEQAAAQFLDHDEYRNAVARGRKGIRKRMEDASNAILKIRDSLAKDKTPNMNSPILSEEQLQELERGANKTTIYTTPAATR